MLKDITIGQYFPVESPVHHLDSRTKLVLSFSFIIFLFMAHGVGGIHPLRGRRGHGDSRGPYQL